MVLGVVPDGPVADPEVAAYNFRRPPQIPRDRHLQLEALHSRFAQDVQAFLSTRLRQQTDVAIAAIEVVPFAEFRMALGEPCAAWSIALGDPRGTAALIDLDARFVGHLIDRLFGGPGQREAAPRAPTPLELRVLHGVAQRILGCWQEAWVDRVALVPSLGGFESRPENLLLLPPGEHMLVVHLRVQSGAGEGLFSVGVPVLAVEAWLQDPAAVTAHPGAVPTTADRELIAVHVRAARVPVSVRLPDFALRTEDLIALREGQVIETGHAAQGLVELRVGDRPLYLGELGRHQGGVVLRVAEAVRPAATAVRLPRRKVLP